MSTSTEGYLTNSLAENDLIFSLFFSKDAIKYLKYSNMMENALKLKKKDNMIVKKDCLQRGSKPNSTPTTKGK